MLHQDPLHADDSTGLFSVYTEHEGNEIMFHVSTLLPFTPNSKQQLPRKRYIGNDIVTVVFQVWQRNKKWTFSSKILTFFVLFLPQDPGALPFIPNLKSQYQHVFIVVRAHNPCTDNTQYR